MIKAVKTTLGLVVLLVCTSNAFSQNWDDSQAIAEGRIWVDKEANAEYQYVGAGDYYEGENLCKSVGRRIVRFGTLQGGSGRLYGWYDLEKAALRLINSPLRKFLGTKYNHAPIFAFVISPDHLGFSYADEPSKVKVLEVEPLLRSHIICVSRWH